MTPERRVHRAAGEPEITNPPDAATVQHDVRKGTGMKRKTIEYGIKRAVKEMMKDQKITPAELARRLKVSRPAITQMFRDESWTIERLQRVTEAIGCNLHVRFTQQPDELLTASKTVLDGLLARIDAAPGTAVPVFDGIADLHAAINRFEEQTVSAV